MSRKNYFIFISSAAIGCLLWSGYTLPSIKSVVPFKELAESPAIASLPSDDGHALSATAPPPADVDALSATGSPADVDVSSATAPPPSDVAALSATAPPAPAEPNDGGINTTEDRTAPEAEEEEENPVALRDILANYYADSEVGLQERAFSRIIGWKEDFEDIAAQYPHVDWKMLSAVVKAETQGKTGNRESSANAIGISQIRYQGAWAFLWDALFSKEVKHGSHYVKDYFNANLRRRYRVQLQQIRSYLKEQQILVVPTDRSETAYREAKFASWNNLKVHLRKKFKPGQYQVAVDIAAMYIDHLIITFHRIRRQVEEIRIYLADNGLDRDGQIEFSGSTGLRWASIKSKLPDRKGGRDFRNQTLNRLDHILERIEDPRIYSAAYNFGLSKCLKYIESGWKLPGPITQYVKDVAAYHAILDQIDASKLYG